MDHKIISPGRENRGLSTSINTMATTSRPQGPLSGRRAKEPLVNYLNSKSLNPNDDALNARLTIKVECGTKAFEHIVEAPSTTIKELSTKLFKPMKKPTSKSDSKSVPKQEPLFGVPLTRTMQTQQSKMPDLLIPAFLKESIRYLLRKGLGIEGIFRTDGAKSELRELIDAINTGEELNLAEFKDAVLIGDLIKTYLQELPEPLIITKYYPTFLAVEAIPQDLQIDALKKIISCLPPPHQVFLQELLALFYQVSLNSAVNFMTAENLAIVFSPIIVWKKDSTVNNNNVVELVKEMNKSAKVLALGIKEHQNLFPTKLQEEVERGHHAPEFSRKLVGHRSTIQAIAFSSHTREVWTGDHLGVIRIWNSEMCIFTKKIALNKGIIFSMIPKDDQMWIASSNCLQIRNLKENTDIVKEFEGTFFSLLLVGDVIWAGSVGQLHLFKGHQFQRVIELKTNKKILALVATNDRVWVVADTVIYIVKIETGEVVHEIREAHSKKINDVIVINECAWTGSDDHTIKIWRLNSYDMVHQIEAHSHAVLGLSVFGSHVWSCSADKSIRIWESSTCEKLSELNEYQHSDVILKATPIWNSGSKKCIAWTTSADASICLWETAYKIGLNKESV
eukprot:TRINITY_DN7907_c0_g1_i1.p1 TRINITY_DN7907_c0_g1~~TRINITY_DN7907_c0_g1_i1.p1  ORF type:complete len:621 (-),score=86.93 TRINITY_DN7907_c0_g1_i1:58-1920(-)